MNWSPYLFTAAELFTLGIGFALWMISYVFLPLGSSTAGPHSSRSCCQPLWSGGAGRHSVRWVALWLTTLSGCGQIGLSIEKTSILRIQIRQICTLLSSLFRMCLWLGPADGITTWSLQVGEITTWSLQVGIWSAKIHVLVVAPFSPSLSQSDSQCLSPADCPTVHMRCDQSRGSWKVTHSTGGSSCPPGFSFLTGGTWGSGETSLHGAALAWGRGMWSVCRYFSYPSNVLCLGLWGTVGSFSLTLCSRILSVVSSSCYSWRGCKSQEQPTSPSLWYNFPPCVFEERKTSLDVLLKDLRKDHFLLSRPTCLLSLNVLIFCVLSCKYLFPETIYFSSSFFPPYCYLKLAKGLLWLMLVCFLFFLL